MSRRIGTSHLTPDQRVIAWRLASGHVASVADLIHHLYGTPEDGGAAYAVLIIRGYMTHIRKFVGRKSGITIESMYGVGYAVRGDLDLYRSLLADEIARNVRLVSNRPRRGTGKHEQQQVVV